MDYDETARALLGDLQADPTLVQFTADGLPEGTMGTEMARMFLTQLADRIEEDGWDQPDSLWVIRTPAATMAEMDAAGIAVPTDAYMLGVAHIDHFYGTYLEYLPRAPAADTSIAGAILVYEGWVSPSGQSPPSQADDRVDVRTLTLLPRTGDSYSLQIVRGGEVTFSGDHGEGVIRGPLVAVLGHWLGRRSPNSQFTTPALFGHLVWQHVAHTLARAGGAMENDGIPGDIADRTLTALAARIMVGVATQCVLPFVASASSSRPESDVAALRECADSSKFPLDPEVATHGLAIAHTVAQEIPLAQAVAAHQSLLPDLATPELAEWAGESLMGALLTTRLLGDTEQWRAVARSVSPAAAQTVEGLLGRLGWDAGTEIDPPDMLWAEA